MAGPRRSWRNSFYMKEQRHRILCAVCALALVLTAVLAPAAWAADGAGEVQDTASPPSLRACRRDAAGRRRCDGPDRQRRIRADVPGKDGSPRPLRSWMSWPGRAGAPGLHPHRRGERMVSFTYRCSVLGGILLTLPDELDEMTFERRRQRPARPEGHCSMHSPAPPRCP